MTINPNQLTFHFPRYNTPARSNYGGDRDDWGYMDNSELNNEFSDILYVQTLTGTVDYRKQFVYNQSGEWWEDVKVWVAENTPATGDTIEICLAGPVSLVREPASYWYPVSYISPTLFRATARPVNLGEHVFDWDNDPTMENHREVVGVAMDGDDTLVTISASFGTITSGQFTLGVTPATMFSYYACATIGEALGVDVVKPYWDIGVWKRRTVASGAEPYGTNSVTVRFESED